ncbi:hypothetical protein BC941DRAFT_426235 [Chlamydoabsidia padenii]|nr:hypothetical protein BC941DRAFT_426235 [Chlamydoabsidia padenii]
MRSHVFAILLASLSIVYGELLSYDDLDCHGTYITHKSSEGCIDMTKIISNRVIGSAWKFYPTLDCSGQVFYLAHSQVQEEAWNRKKECIVDNKHYPFVAQSARPVRHQ